ncbi:hypothetical protein NDU88_006665 [Pleurodeles waltl]|uniref:Uncharacterized protein n=1 Tax=Pleurodeles waltl TaxID=8319 RepID=A0AAV7PJ07_PLEWA|nr:hypothetical protein NDU88_006665 [Pleurodeles waltl]
MVAAAPLHSGPRLLHFSKRRGKPHPQGQDPAGATAYRLEGSPGLDCRPEPARLGHTTGASATWAPPRRRPDRQWLHHRQGAPTTPPVVLDLGLDGRCRTFALQAPASSRLHMQGQATPPGPGSSRNRGQHQSLS